MNKTLKVALFTNIIPPYYRPVFEHLRDLFHGLKIFVSAPSEPNRDWNSDWGKLPVTVQKCWTYTTHWQHEQGFSDKVWRHFPYDTLLCLIRDKPDVVISIQLGFRTLQAVIYRKLVRKSRLIIWTGLSEHTEKGLPAWRIAQRKALLSVADAVLVNGASGVNYLMSLGIPREKIFLEPYCAEILPYLELPLEREENIARRLLYVGQLTTRKGIEPFLKVFSEWLRKHPSAACEFWIAGDGPLRAELESIPVPPQLKLRFLGSIAYENLPGLYAQAGIFVFPTLADEWGVVVNEALAAGLPVLGSLYSQAFEELVEDGVNGWTFRPDHPEEIYLALERMMATEKEKLATMRRAGRTRAGALTPEFGARCFHAAIDFVYPLSEKDGSRGKPLANDSGSIAKLEAPIP
ncbi:MAG TPA: glycosyltransferase family 4 protein [Bryobacteraceae bacterium]|nr:glycosyltransferase family 4 protein [Bryobacteraceae bacterium]